jgi:alkanesulfonate monooxygenase
MGAGDGLPGPTDAWTTLAGLARDTSRIRLGTLMSSATFRLPGPLAITVAQVDQMSGGRVELGIGTGWYAAEHTAYGIPFPSLKERFDRFAEQLAIITGLWGTPAGQRFAFDGDYYKVIDSPALPKPVQDGGPPVILGGAGATRTPALAAQYAVEMNTPFLGMEAAARQFERADAERAKDRPTLVRSAAQVLCVGKDDASLRGRAEFIGRDLDELRANAIAGTPGEVVDTIGRWRERTGISRLYLQLLDLSDVDQVELIASEVRPQL